MPNLHVITCSTRPARQGRAVATWFLDVARAHGGFDVVDVDLALVALPMFDEPNHPVQQAYTHEHTKRWSAQVASADAFVFVTPEYNHGPPPSLVNAITFLAREWACKVAGFVSYGGVSGGSRAVEGAKVMLTTLKVVPLPEAVTLPFFRKLVGDDGVFRPGEVQEKAGRAMLDEMLRWDRALRTLRTP